MFVNQECINAIKDIARNSDYEDKSYCQRLDICSREFGFNNFHHLRKIFPDKPTDYFHKTSLKIMRRYAETTKPKLNSEYYEFYAKKGPETTHIAFYSQWIGWDSLGREVRVPRPIFGNSFIDDIRRYFARYQAPVYVVENEKLLVSWLFDWYGVALIPKNIALAHFRERFDRKSRVCENVPTELIKACKQDYSSNIAY